MIEITERDGVIMSAGTMPRPTDRDEDKYSRVKAGPPPTSADLSRAVSLVTAKGDPRPEIFFQSALGSCAACSAKGAVETVRNWRVIQAGKTPDAKLINPGPVYTKARQKRGWFPNDSGAYMADCCDELLSGIYLLSDGPYSDFAGEAYPNYPFHGEFDYQLSHQPFYPSDGNTLEHIWNALSQGYAVQQGCYWADEFYAPTDGKMPTGVTEFLSVGHATFIWGYIPGWLLCTNTWDKKWNPNAARFGHDLRPGDFAMPASYYVRSGPFFEFRVISGELVNFQPEPEPVEPVDQGYHLFDALVLKATTGKLWLDPAVDLPNLKGRSVRGVTRDGVSFQGKVKRNDDDVMVLKGAFDAALKDAVVQVETSP